MSILPFKVPVEPWPARELLEQLSGRGTVTHHDGAVIAVQAPYDISVYRGPNGLRMIRGTVDAPHLWDLFHHHAHLVLTLADGRRLPFQYEGLNGEIFSHGWLSD